MNFVELSTILSTRVSDIRFIELLKTQEKLYRKLDAMTENLSKQESRVEIRESTRAIRNISEQIDFLKAKIDKYKALDAQIAVDASTVRTTQEKQDGTFLTFTGQRIGSLTVASSYEPNTPEWLKEREHGIGGSDIGGIMRTDPKYGRDNYHAVFSAKMGNPEPLNTACLAAIHRGTAWEDYIRFLYADLHPEQHVAFCKDSWKADEPHSYRHGNFDGLLLDDNGNPSGILEIKTGRHSSHWGNPEDGIFGIPANYRQQVLWYSLNSHIPYGVVVAVLDDYDYREYQLDFTDPRLQPEIDEIIRQTDHFWTVVQKSKNHQIPTFVKKGFAKTINVNKEAERFSCYAGISEEEASDRLHQVLAHVDDIHDINTEMTELYASYNPATRLSPLIGIDLETNSETPRTGRIIETGIVSLNPDGTRTTLYQSVHGLPEQVIQGRGTGELSVHQITCDLIAGYPLFEEVGDILLEFLMRGVMVAHNASFEDRFLTANLDGYAEARDSGKIRILDTKVLAKRFMLEAPNNTLESFTTWNGVPYVGAHAAYTDTDMMMEALWNFQKSMFENGRFVSHYVAGSDTGRNR